MIIIGFATAGGGTVLGMAISGWISPKTTSLDVLVDPSFGVSIWHGDTEHEVFTSRYNCSMIGMMAMKIDWEDYNDIYAYLKADVAHFLDDTNGGTISGNPWHTFGWNMETISEKFMDFMGTPDEEARFDGNKHNFDLGYYVVVVPVIVISTYVGGYHSFGFTFQSILDFMDAISGPGVFFDTFSTTDFLKGHNTMVITELKFDEINHDESLLSVVFNGVEMDLPWTNMGP